MTSQKIKFYKFNDSTNSKVATAKATEGAVIYLVDVKELWIGGATPKLVVAGSTDVAFSNNILTITTHNDNGVPTTQTLDFNDVASAQETFHVFQKVYQLMGTTASGTTQTLDYSETNYLTELGTEGKPAKNLVNADKALDKAIHDNSLMGADSTAVYDKEHLSSTWTDVVDANAVKAADTVKAGVEKVDKKVAQLANEVIANEQVTQEAFTTVANSVGLKSDMSLDLSDASQTGAIHGDKDVKSALIHLDNAISTNQLDVQVDGSSIVSNHVANINTEDTYNASTNKLATKATVTNAINTLNVDEYAQAEIDTTKTSGETAFKVKGIKEVDGKIGAGTNTVDLKIDGTYNASNNKIATQSTVTTAINNLNVDTNKGAASISGSTITINAVQQENGLIKDGTSTTINLDGTYNATDNKIATKSTVTEAINALDTTADVQAVEYTAASGNDGVKLTFKGVSETDGKIAQGSGATALQFAKVATTGAAADVTYTNTTSGMTATNVQAAIDELDGRVDSLVGGMRYNGDISTATATLNGTTNDIRPGDIYLASGGFQIGSTSVEAGDMIVYKGDTSKTEVALTNSNCTIIERETDTMVTAGGTLTDDYIVFGNGNKEVTTTSNDSYEITASQLNTAITKANSALQSISKGEDGTYVTTTVEAKDANNDQKVSVALKYGTVTYSAKDGDTPANLTVTSGNEGVLNTNAITPIKNYVDEKVSNVVSDLDVDEYAQASVVVDTTNHASTLKIKGIQETDGKIAAATKTPTTDVAIDGVYDASDNKIATQSTVTNTINNLDKPSTTATGTNVSVTYSEADGIVTVDSVSESYATITRTAKASGVTPNLVVTSGDDSKLVKASDIANTKLYTDDKIADEIEKLDANVTSNNGAVATVQVVETDGKVTGVNVTNVSAGVSYTASTASTQPNLTASTSTGAVTGGDISKIKQYVDAVNCWEEYE